MFQQIWRLNWLGVIGTIATLHCLLDPLRRDAFLDNLIVDAVEVVCLLTENGIFKNLLASFVPIRFSFYLELDVVDG